LRRCAARPRHLVLSKNGRCCSRQKIGSGALLANSKPALSRASAPRRTKIRSRQTSTGSTPDGGCRGVRGRLRGYLARQSGRAASRQRDDPMSHHSSIRYDRLLQVRVPGFLSAALVVAARSRGSKPSEYLRQASLQPFARTELRFPTVTRLTDPYRRAAGHPACGAGQFFRRFFLMLTIIRTCLAREAAR
jgi:hypothetical protein